MLCIVFFKKNYFLGVIGSIVFVICLHLLLKQTRLDKTKETLIELKELYNKIIYDNNDKIKLYKLCNKIK